MPSKVTDPHDLLIHKLGVMLNTEKAIERMLPKLAREANREELAQGFERHLEQTRQHVKNVEEALSMLGAPAQGVPAPAIEGLEAQHLAFAAEAADDVRPEVLDLVAAASAAATEHHEIAAYEALVTMAQSLGQTDLAGVLERNLREDREMLQGAEQILERLSREAGAELAAR